MFSKNGHVYHKDDHTIKEMQHEILKNNQHILLTRFVYTSFFVYVRQSDLTF